MAISMRLGLREAGTEFTSEGRQPSEAIGRMTACGKIPAFHRHGRYHYHR